MRRKKALINVLILFHQKNLVRDYPLIDAIEIEKRKAVIAGLRAMIQHPRTEIKLSSTQLTIG